MASVTLTVNNLYPQNTEKVVLSWDNTALPGNVLSQLVYYGIDNDELEDNTSALVGNNEQSLELTTLTIDTTYKIWVVVVTIDGTDVESFTSAVHTATTTILIPNTPTLVSASRGDENSLLEWTHVNDGTNDATHFTFVYSQDGGTTNTTTIAVDGPGISSTNDSNLYTYTYTLPLGEHKTYEISVLALNDAGASATSNFIRFTTSGVPTAPRSFNPISNYNEQIPIEFVAPLNDYGYAITAYYAVVGTETILLNNVSGFTDTSTNKGLSDYSPGNVTVTLTSNDLTIENGKAYDIYVYAINQEAIDLNTTGDNSTTIGVIPANVSSSPTILATSDLDHSVNLDIGYGILNGSQLFNYTLTITGGTVGSVNWNGSEVIATDSKYVFNNPSSSENIEVIVNGLTNGTLYTFLLTNYTSTVNESSVVEATATPAGPASAPTITSASSADKSSVLVFNAEGDSGDALDGSTLLSYVLTVSPEVLTPTATSDGTVTWFDTTTGNSTNVSGTSNGNQTQYILQGTSTNATITGLVNGETYTFTLQTVTSSTLISPSSADITATPAGQPSAPTITATSLQDGKSDLEFSNGFNDVGLNGSTLTGYILTISPYDNGMSVTGWSGTQSNVSGVFTLNGTDSTVTVTGLTNANTYTFSLQVVTLYDTSDSSTGATATPAGAPDAPVLTLTNNFDSSNNGVLDLSWTTPNNNGSDIQSYTIDYSTDDLFNTFNQVTINGTVVNGNVTVSPGTSTTLTSTEVTEGSTYYVRIKAYNGSKAGTSDNSTVQNSTIYGQLEITGVTYTGTTLTINVNEHSMTNSKEIVYAQITPNIDDQVRELGVTDSSEFIDIDSITNLTSIVILTSEVYPSVVYSITSANGTTIEPTEIVNISNTYDD